MEDVELGENNSVRNISGYYEGKRNLATELMSRDKTWFEWGALFHIADLFLMGNYLIAAYPQTTEATRD